MSSKGICLNKAVMENLFGLLKSEPFYLQSFHSIDEVKWELVHYLDFYSHNQIKVKLEG